MCNLCLSRISICINTGLLGICAEGFIFEKREIYARGYIYGCILCVKGITAVTGTSVVMGQTWVCGKKPGKTNTK